MSRHSIPSCFVWLGWVLPGLLVACGSRGPLDLEPRDDLVEGGVDAAVTLDAALLVDAGVKDARALPAIIECGICVTQKCGPKVAQCVQDPECQKALQCIGQKCVTKGLDFKCLAQCTGNDPQTALQAFSIAQCVTSTCGAACAAGLPGVLGGG